MDNKTFLKKITYLNYIAQADENNNFKPQLYMDHLNTELGKLHELAQVTKFLMPQKDLTEAEEYTALCVHMGYALWQFDLHAHNQQQELEQYREMSTKRYFEIEKLKKENAALNQEISSIKEHWED